MDGGQDGGTAGVLASGDGVADVIVTSAEFTLTRADHSRG